MKIKFFSWTVVIGAMFFLLHCGGEGASQGSSPRDGGNLHVVVKNSTSQATEPYARIAAYRVVVTGEGMATPIEALFSGESETGVIEGVPVGGNRLLTVEAVNNLDQTIRAGDSEPFEVEGGKTATVPVELESVPIFVNVSPGSRIENTRLVLKAFSDPNTPLEFFEGGEGDASLMSEVFSDETRGIADYAPTLLPAGEHTFTVRHSVNGRWSRVSLDLLDGTRRRAAPLFSTGLTTPSERGKIQQAGVAAKAAIVMGRSAP